MSKSKGNHIGITEEPDDIFGKVMSVDDETMKTWYPLLVDRDPQFDDPNEAKKWLATLVTERFHGRERAQDTRVWWDKGRPPRNLETVRVSSEERLYKIVVEAGMAKSGGDARRKIAQGGVSVDGARMEDPNHVLASGTYTLKVGKKLVKKIVVE